MMIDTARRWVEGHFGLLLMSGLLGGLFLPMDLTWAAGAVPVLLAIIIYFSCFKITWDDLGSVQPVHMAAFYVVRFFLLPVLAFYAAGVFLPEYKFALLLLLLIPSGVTLPAVTAIIGGNPVMALGMLALSSVLAPFIIPAAFAVLSGAEMQVDSMGMLWTLTKIVFLPAALYALSARAAPRIVKPMSQHASAVAVILISVIALIIVSNYRQDMLADIPFLLQASVIGAVVYGGLYIGGWHIFKKLDRRAHISYALMSGNNNIALGISLAFLYLPVREIAILVIWELSWLSGLAAFQYFLSKRKQE